MDWDDFWDELGWYKATSEGPQTVTFIPKGGSRKFDLATMTKEWVRIP